MNAFEIMDLKKQMLAKDAKSTIEEIRLKTEHDLNIDSLNTQHEKDLLVLDEEEEIILNKDIPDLQNEIHVYNNQYVLKEGKQ